MFIGTVVPIQTCMGPRPDSSQCVNIIRHSADVNPQSRTRIYGRQAMCIPMSLSPNSRVTVLSYRYRQFRLRACCRQCRGVYVERRRSTVEINRSMHVEMGRSTIEMGCRLSLIVSVLSSHTVGCTCTACNRPIYSICRDGL